MKSLKTILQSNLFFVIISFLLTFYVLYFTVIKKYQSNFSDGPVTIEGKVSKYMLSDDKLVIYLDTNKELVKATYYFKDNVDININFNDTYILKGNMSMPPNNTIPNNFNYRRYLYHSKIYKVMSIKSLTKKEESHNILANIKSFIYQRAYQNDYLLLFICGDKTLMDSDTYNNFKDVGIAHLLAISGMHVSVFIAILSKLFFFLKENNRKVVIIIFLFFYSYIVNFSPSILRVIIFFTLSFLFKRLKIKISSIKCLFFTGYIILFINPFNFYMTAFQYSFITSLSIILVQKRLSQNYFINIILISFWTLLFTLPITASLNYEINIITFLSNLLFIPYVSFFLYPFALICFLIPKLLIIFSFFTGLMEKVIGFLSQISFLTINIPKMSTLVIILIYLFLFLFVLLKKKRYFFLVLGLIISAKIKPKLDSNNYVIFFDVGQGDSSIIISGHQKDIILIDTGGVRGKKVSDGVILFLKSIGITHLDYLIFSHGDFDHMGESENIINNLKVKKVIFNDGPYNDLELELIKTLKRKHIAYTQKDKKLPLKNFNLSFFPTKIYDNENDNSRVTYLNIYNHQFLFMGDAGVGTEQNLLAKYSLSNIDVLKVGHHGSKTSSNSHFISQIKPQYAIISVGKNNLYGHPNKEVLNTLSKTKIYRTDQDGSVIFKINEKKFKIEKSAP